MKQITQCYATRKTMADSKYITKDAKNNYNKILNV